VELLQTEENDVAIGRDQQVNSEEGPEYPQCPISLEPMTDPIILDCGGCKPTIDRVTWNDWLVKQGDSTNQLNCPRCGDRLLSLRVSPNVEFREYIEKVQSLHGVRTTETAETKKSRKKSKKTKKKTRKSTKPNERKETTPDELSTVKVKSDNEVEVSTTSHEQATKSPLDVEQGLLEDQQEDTNVIQTSASLEREPKHPVDDNVGKEELSSLNQNETKDGGESVQNEIKRCTRKRRIVAAVMFAVLVGIVVIMAGLRRNRASSK